MAFLGKVWANSPATTTPLSAAALDDLETRVTNIGWGGVTAQTGAIYTAVAGDVVYANPASGGQTVTLPAVTQSTTVAVVAGSSVSNSNQITISRAGSATISGKGLVAVTSFNLISAGDNVTLASDGTNWYIVAGQFGLTGAVNITASESRTNTAYGTLTTPDQVTNIVLPTNGLIAVWYQATWGEIASASARAAIFLGSNQIQSPTSSALGVQAAAINTVSGAGGGTSPLASFYGGLASVENPGSTYGGDTTTGQAVGVYGGAGVSGINTVIVNGTTIDNLGTNFPVGGPCYIFAAAGTYTVSVQFKATTNTVTASNRKLWVEAKPF